MRREEGRAAGFGRDAAAARTLPELNGLFNSFVRSYGFTAYAVGFLPVQQAGDQPFLLIDWPRVWLELYAREGFAADDAVVAAAAGATEPFTWSELQARSPGASARIFAAARAFGWSDGLLVPIRTQSNGPDPLLGVASLAAPTLEWLDGAGRQTLAETSALAFAHAVKLAGSRLPAKLSDRERQALSLVASGRGDREIGTVLNVSTATAHFHVEQAKRKLGAITRAQAVATAVRLGIVDCS